MANEVGPRARFAARLRQLLNEADISAKDVAAAIGVSQATLSNWLSLKAPTLPPEYRIRSLAEVLAGSDADRVALEDELEQLREQISQLPASVPSDSEARARSGSRLFTGDDFWALGDDQPVTIVGSRMPDRILEGIPFADPRHPNHIRLIAHADIDAIVNVYGQVRASNPDSDVSLRTPGELRPDDLSGHVIGLGYGPWNPVNDGLIDEIGVRIEWVADESAEREFDDFVRIAESGREPLEFRPEFGPSASEARPGRPFPELTADLALVVRGPSPNNVSATWTVCAGIFSRGTYAAVRATTDGRVGLGNVRYLRRRFGDADRFAILMRVPVVNDVVSIPDLLNADRRLWEWPSA